MTACSESSLGPAYPASDMSDVNKLALQTPDQVADPMPSDDSRASRKRPRDNCSNLARLVSIDAQYISENDEDDDTKAMKEETSVDLEQKTEMQVPHLPNPLYKPKFLSAHITSLRLEAELFPMRVQVARLMAHPTHNRRGLFNVPVDPLALGLVDYHLVVPEPMDLGTIKAKVHALSYNSRDEVADDIRLVFTNAMKYNPPNNPVHVAAKSLLHIFEEAYQVMKATSDAPRNTCVKNASSSGLDASDPMQMRGSSVRCVSTQELAFDCRPSDSLFSPLTPPRNELQPVLSIELPKAGYDQQKLSSSAQPTGNTFSPRHVSMVGPMISQDVNSSPFKAAGALCLSVEESRNPFAAPPPADKALQRALNVAVKQAKHSCRSCRGRSCGICEQGCLSHEPALLICTGTNCLGAKIRKGAVYYIAKDGSRQFCQRCYTNLQAVLPHTRDQMDSFGSSVRYKRDLLKRKNEEEVAEAWLTCKSCQQGIHKICSMHNEFVYSEEEYECPSCAAESSKPFEKSKGPTHHMEIDVDIWSFVSGYEIPVKQDEVLGACDVLSAESLPETPMSAFIQAKVRDCIVKTNIPNAEKTITVRIISDCSKKFKVPDVVRNHFRQPGLGVEYAGGVVPPARVNYVSKAITLFQKIDGLDVCIFCMYVQEYDCKDEFEGRQEGDQTKRVYIAYLDSVAHFRPRECRTEVFHEILVAYLATARARGYESAHIWACPPSRGNSFVFWNHPSSQRTPSKERLISWYHGALSRGIDSGVITNVKSLFESSFPLETVRSLDPVVALNPDNMTVREDRILDGRMACPPLMDGDYWIEEAVRLHASNIVRHLKSKPTFVESVVKSDGCPASQVACVIRDRVMIQNCASPFTKPVNAVALQLTDYHKIIKKPMDLGTVYSRCILGEFETLAHVVDDVELVFSNAMKFNPKGHTVHSMAIETRDLFFKELNELTECWQVMSVGSKPVGHSWKNHAHVSMNLDNVLDLSPHNGSDALGDTSSQVALHDHNELSFTQAKETFISDTPPALDEHESLIQELFSPATPQAVKSLKPLTTNLLPHMVKPSPQSTPNSSKKSARDLNSLMDTKLELLSGGQDAILQRMVGDDVWMMDKKGLNPPKATPTGKKKGGSKGKGKRRASSGGASASTVFVEEPQAKRRRQSWLGEEVGMSVRKMRTSFFTCSLVANKGFSIEEEAKERQFHAYVEPFINSTISKEPVRPCRIADARHAFLEFSQYRNLEFDTLRRAKYSTFVLLYHLHNDDAPGLIPQCSSCNEIIKEIRWHRIRRVEERHHTGRVPPTLRAARMAEIGIPSDEAEACHKGEELCASCFDQRSNKEDFIPLPVSLKAR